MLATKIEEAKKDEGFTLIELLVVVIIIGILAAIAIPVFLNQRERAWVRTAEADARNAAIAVESVFNDGFVYPAGQTFTPGACAEFTEPAITDEVCTSPQVTLVYAVDATDDSRFTIQATHGLLDAADAPHATYDSAAGGLQ